MNKMTGKTRGRRVYVRRFDYEEAQSRYDAGESLSALAAEYGVTYTAVWQVVTPAGRHLAKRSADNVRARTVGQGICDDCGGPMSAASRRHGSTRCMPCAARARATTVRAGELRCNRCREWKIDENFPMNRSKRGARRGRHQQCRACSTILRREYRERHKVPCIGCGKPVLPPREKGPHGYHEPRCLECSFKARRGSFAKSSKESEGGEREGAS